MALSRWITGSASREQTPHSVRTRAARGMSSPRRAGISRLRPRGQVEAEVFGRILRVGEHDRLVVVVDHAAVVGGHVLLELGRVEVARLITERLGDLVVVDLEHARAVDADHRGQIGHLDVVLLGQDLGDDRPDLVVHQREPGHVRGGVVGLERALGGLERGHWPSSFGASRLTSLRMPANRFLAASSESSKRGGLASGCDHSGCSVRAAAMVRPVQVDSQPPSRPLLWSANSRSLVSRWNIGMVYRRSRSAKSYSSAPMMVGVTKSPLRGAACITRRLRNSSPTSGSNTTLAAKMASPQSSIAVSCSATSRTPCQTGSSFQAVRCAVPSKPSISSLSVRLYSARSCADLIRCMLFTEIALLCMLVGARRLALANRYRPSPWSTCIQAPTCDSTKLTQFRLHWSKALLCRATSTFWLSCLITLALYR